MLEYFESDTHIFIVMEFCEWGDLLCYLKQNGVMTEKEARAVFT